MILVQWTERTHHHHHLTEIISHISHKLQIATIRFLGWKKRPIVINGMRFEWTSFIFGITSWLILDRFILVQHQLIVVCNEIPCWINKLIANFFPKEYHDNIMWIRIRLWLLEWVLWIWLKCFDWKKYTVVVNKKWQKTIMLAKKLKERIKSRKI
jgi:hypothetical protein